MGTTTAPATNKTNQKTINITRVFDMPVEKLWKAWTDAETVKKWWGPTGFTCPYSSIDLKPGGKSLSCMRGSDGKEYWSTGVYKEIIPYKKIVSTDNFSDEKGNVVPAASLDMPGDWPEELLITASFEATGDKTRLELEHVGIPQEMYEECIQGWQQSFDKLEQNVR